MNPLSPTVSSMIYIRSLAFQISTQTIKIFSISRRIFATKMHLLATVHPIKYLGLHFSSRWDFSSICALNSMPLKGHLHHRDLVIDVIVEVVLSLLVGIVDKLVGSAFGYFIGILVNFAMIFVCIRR